MRNQYQIHANEDIRERLTNKKLPIWRLAMGMGVSEGTVVRWLRTDLSLERKNEIIDTIEHLAREG